MRRLIETSVGRVALDARNVAIGGVSVTISAFNDDGWELASHTWGERWNESQTLAQALADTTGLPPDEAEQAAADTVREWKRRGGDVPEDARGVIAALAGTFGLAALGVIALAAVLVWLAIALP